MAGISSYAQSSREIIERYAPMVYRIALNRTRTPADAEDVMQEVFLRYIRRERFFESEEHLKAYLIRSTLHRCQSLFASAHRRHSAALPENLCERAAVTEAVRALPPKLRDVVYLYYYERCSVAETAKLLGRKESAVKTALHRARLQLKEALKEDFTDV